MKKLLYFMSVLLCLCMSLPAQAEHYFRPGTVWEYESWIWPDVDYTPNFEVIGEEMSLDGETVIPFMYGEASDMSDLETIYYLKVDGDRVFWRYPEEKDWYLLYDFGIKVGESVEVSRPYRVFGKKERVFTSTNYCTERHFTDKDGVEWILFEQYDSMHGDHPVEGWWIEGIGACSKPFMNNFFGLAGGPMINLHQVTIADGTVVYLSSEWIAGMDVPGFDSEASEAGSSEIYNLQGQRVGLSVEGLAPGIYVRKCDGRSQKIRVK